MSEDPKRPIAGGYIGAVIGGFVGYVAMAIVLCRILYPDSNQCALPAVFIGWPVGAIIGWIAGTFLTRTRP